MSEETIELKDATPVEEVVEQPTEEVPVPQNQAKVVKEGLTGFIGQSFNRIEDNYDLEKRVNEAIYERLPEADFSQLLELKGTLANSNNSAMTGALKPFVSQNSDKAIISENLKNDDTANLASSIYGSTQDKKQLQSLAYLWSIISSMPQPNVVDITQQEEKK